MMPDARAGPPHVGGERSARSTVQAMAKAESSNYVLTLWRGSNQMAFDKHKSGS
jgi:hypothetical protein